MFGKQPQGVLLNAFRKLSQILEKILCEEDHFEVKEKLFELIQKQPPEVLCNKRCC